MKGLEVRLRRAPDQERVVGRLAETGARSAGGQLVQSLARASQQVLIPSCDYGQLLEVTRILTRNHQDVL